MKELLFYSFRNRLKIINIKGCIDLIDVRHKIYDQEKLNCGYCRVGLFFPDGKPINEEKD